MSQLSPEQQMLAEMAAIKDKFADLEDAMIQVFAEINILRVHLGLERVAPATELMSGRRSGVGGEA
jgi:hypothetical protein